MNLYKVARFLLRLTVCMLVLCGAVRAAPRAEVVIGAAVGPYLIGAVGNWFGLETSIWFGPVASLSLALVALLWLLRERGMTAKATS